MFSQKLYSHIFTVTVRQGLEKTCLFSSHSNVWYSRRNSEFVQFVPAISIEMKVASRNAKLKPNCKTVSRNKYQGYFLFPLATSILRVHVQNCKESMWETVKFIRRSGSPLSFWSKTTYSVRCTIEKIVKIVISLYPNRRPKNANC